MNQILSFATYKLYFSQMSSVSNLHIILINLLNENRIQGSQPIDYSIFLGPPIDHFSYRLLSIMIARSFRMAIIIGNQSG